MGYLFAAYVAIWCILFVYVFSLQSRLRNLEKTLDILQKKVEK